ncbi:E3 SUMO-protein ligase ZBED1 [Anopheles darlingi]|uniref:E3 SUMO-protein ligase ZBED1 n=1 Tax=Anopheles darlingi TaxID=43151 RepID=UPI0020FFFF15|nr:E3 SUMO-protein ligase ZBED1 [Anopheles darlingi]
MAENKKSGIWCYFESSSSTPEKKRCTICKQQISVKNKSTYNMIRHFKNKHPTVAIGRNTPADDTSDTPGSNNDGNTGLPKPQTQEQSSLAKYVNIMNPLNVDRKKSLDNKLLNLICSNALPFRLVETEDFKEFINDLNPNYNLPTRKTLSTTLLNSNYAKLLKRVKHEVANAVAVCLTVDGWTNLQNESFLAATAHFINGEANLKNFLLECDEFSNKDTSENITRWFKSVMSNFGITHNVVCIVTDKGANMERAVNLTDVSNLPCFAHTLNLIVQDALNNSISRTVSVVKGIVKYYKKNPAALNKLKEYQDRLGFTQNKLILDVVTRWNSTYHMLERFYENKDPILATLPLLSCSLTQLDQKDWVIIKDSIDVLKFFDLVTLEISAEKTVTLSKIRVITELMIKKIDFFLRPGLVDEVESLVKFLKDGMEKKLQYLDNEIVQQATVLDPRFKQKGFKNDLDFKQCCAKILDRMESINPISNNDEERDIECNVTDASWATESIWEEFDTPGNDSEIALNTRNCHQIEIDNYIAEPLAYRNDCPLDWWKINKNKYPTLFNLALRTLCIPATSVPCERVFSKAGDIEITKRNRLKSGKLQKILFLKENSAK